MLKEIKLEDPNSFKHTQTLDALLSPRVDTTTITTTVVSPRKLQRSQTDKSNDIVDIEGLQFDPRTTFVIHTVDPKDTLQGLALRYCVTVQEIKKENKIYNPTVIYSQKKLIIPVRRSELLQRLNSRTSEKQETEKEKQETIKHFMQITNTTEAEALQYLKLTQFNVERAIEKHHIDRNIQIPKKNQSALVTDVKTDQNQLEVLPNRALFYKIPNIIRIIVHSLILLLKGLLSCYFIFPCFNLL